MMTGQLVSEIVSSLTNEYNSLPWVGRYIYIHTYYMTLKSSRDDGTNISVIEQIWSQEQPIHVLIYL